MKKTIILFQPKFWPGPLNNEKPLRKKYYHGVRETFRYLPLGLLSVAAVLRDKFDVKIIDQRFDDSWQETVTDILKNTNVLFTGTTACTGYEINGAIEFSKLTRQVAPEVPIVWGGWHASTVPGDTLKAGFVDIVVKGQGEGTALDLAEKLDTGTRDLRGIKGLMYKTAAGSVVEEPDRELIQANDLPDIDYSLVDVGKYLRFKDGTPARLFYVSSIGCPYNCSFCSIAAVYKRHWSSKDPERVVREIRYFVENYGTETVEFDGTIFFANSKWAKNVLTALIESGMKLDYVTSTRADIIVKWDDEMKAVIKESGFKAIGVGAESGSDRVLKIIDKRIKVEDIVESLKILKDLNIDPAYTFMFGIPGEAIEDTKMTLDLMAKLKKIMPESRIAGFFYHPFPGSKTYMEYKEMHNLPDLTLEKWANYSFDLKYSRSLSLADNYLDFVNERVQYLDWAYPEYDEGRGISRKLISRVARLRVDHGFYKLPIEWRLAKSLGKSGRLKDSQSM